MFAKTIVVASAALFAAAKAGKCPDSDVLKIVPLATNVHAASCQTLSGFTLFPLTTYPDDEMFYRMCTSSECREFIDDLRDANPSDCDLLWSGVSINLRMFVDNFSGNCARVVPRSRKPYPPC